MDMNETKLSLINTKKKEKSEPDSSIAEPVQIDYKRLYYELFNSLTDVIESLKETQRRAEEIFIGNSPSS